MPQNLRPYNQRPIYKQLPDGTWLNVRTGVVSAPLQPPMGGAPQKRGPAPAMGPLGVPFAPPQVDANAQMLEGYMPGSMGMRMRTGRNYPALGAYVDAPSYQAVGFIDRLSPALKGILLLGGVVGIATVTVLINKRKKK